MDDDPADGHDGSDGDDSDLFEYDATLDPADDAVPDVLRAGDIEVLGAMPEESVDLIFADPPYFLSNGGVTCQSGKMVSVHKGQWDVWFKNVWLQKKG